MVGRPSIRTQVVEVSQDYLGPAAERFVDRQISTHLKKKSDKLTYQDLTTLIDWLALSFALLTNDSQLVEEYTSRLRLLANGRTKEALSEQWQG